MWKTVPIAIPLWFASCLASLSPASVIDFSGLDGVDASDGNGQTFAWTSDGVSGTVTLFANWTNLPDQNGPIRTATRAPASLAAPFIGTLGISFSQPVEVSLLATFPSLLNDGVDGGRIERVSLSTAEEVAFFAAPNTTALYTGAGSHQITADDEYSADPTSSIWGFVGEGRASDYTFVYTSSRVGFSETFDVVITSVPAPSSGAMLAAALIPALLAIWTRRSCRRPFGFVRVLKGGPRTGRRD